MSMAVKDISEKERIREYSNLVQGLSAEEILARMGKMRDFFYRHMAPRSKKLHLFTMAGIRLNANILPHIALVYRPEGFRAEPVLRSHGGYSPPRIEENLIGISCSFNPEGGFMDFMDADSSNELIQLVEYSIERRYCYGALGFGRDGISRIWQVKALPPVEPLRLELPPSIEAVLIGIGPEQTIHKAILKCHALQPDNEVLPEDPLYWVLYGHPETL